MFSGLDERHVYNTRHKLIVSMQHDPIARDLAVVAEQLADFHKWDPSIVVLIIASHTPRFDYQLVGDVFNLCDLPTRDAGPTIDSLRNTNVLQLCGLGEYQLPRADRERLHAEYRELLSNQDPHPEPELAAASQQLTQLISSVSEQRQRAFCEEALLCSQAGAYRSSVVMAWNFAIDHLLRWIAADPSRTSDFNLSLTAEWHNKSKGIKKSPIANAEDLGEFKESDVVRLARAANLLDKSTFAMLDSALRLRNDAAHPFNSRVFSAPIAAGHLSALVEFVVTRSI